MNILYISIFPIASASQHDVYADVAHELARRGHSVSVATPLERRQKGKTALSREGNELFLRVRTLNNQKVGAVEKMLALFTTPLLMERAIKRHFSGHRFDLILYDTPFVKLAGPVDRLRKRFGTKGQAAATYLLLKDIWPKTLVDMGSMREESALYRCMDAQIGKLYRVSDHIGCFSPACLHYVKSRYDISNLDKFEICPHSVSLLPEMERDDSFREFLGVPPSAALFVYGGNFGIPQGVEFIMEALSSFDGDERVFFALFGAGTEYDRLEGWVRALKGNNIIIRPHLPKADYMALLSAADAGMVFLNRRFTVPNIPSRTLDYLQASLPVIAAVDAATDYSEIIEQNGFGLASLAGDLDAFRANVKKLLDEGIRKVMGKRGRKFFEENWTAEKACDIILAHFPEARQ